MADDNSPGVGTKELKSNAFKTIDNSTAINDGSSKPTAARVDPPNHRHHGRKRKLRVLVITLGGDRQQAIRDMFDDPQMKEDFEPPTFSQGVTSRYIRNQFNFFTAAYDAGLLPQAEWNAIREAHVTKRYEGQPTERFFDCLNDIPITKEGRQGSKEDLQLHYSVELWRKAKAINRSRSVLACVFAHLMAMKTFVSSEEYQPFDLILEDNVRSDPSTCAKRIMECVEAAHERDAQTPNSSCQFRFYGWLSSIPNLKWIMGTHIPKRKFVRTMNTSGDSSDDTPATIAPLPRLEHLEEDLPAMMETAKIDDATKDDGIEIPKDSDTHDVATEQTKQHTHPGGNLLWGAYAYWISKEAYDSLLSTLRNDVGAILWKGKRMRNYAVKPIDKMLPRQTASKFGPESVQIVSQPAFFRAPMLTSKIHSQWDPGFCDSTQHQLKATNLKWSNLWLTQAEREVVDHHQTFGKWLTLSELKTLRSSEETLASNSEGLAKEKL